MSANGGWSAEEARAELGRFVGMGAVVLPAHIGEKAACVKGWPTISVEAAFDLAWKAIRKWPTNLAVRLGQISNGNFLGHIDLDGKCPCGSDWLAHDGQALSPECTDTVNPSAALAALLARFPSPPPIIRTGRGFRVLFQSAVEISDGRIPELGAEIAANAGRQSVIPPSVHPSGTPYEYAGDFPTEVPLIDANALGFEIVGTGTRRRVAPEERNHPVPRGRAREFQDLFALLRIIPGKCVRMAKGGDFYPCPWHTDTEASLQVDWVDALFYCFGCNAGGGLIDLAERLGCADASIFPAPSKRGSWGTYEPEAIHQNLVDLLRRIEPGMIRQSAEATDRCRLDSRVVFCRIGRHPIGDAVRLSCHWPLCPRCGIGRFWRDLIAADAGVPERVQLYRLTLRERSEAANGCKLLGRMSAEMMRVRRNRLVAGSTARFVHFEPGGALVGVALIALPPGTALPPVVGEAWEVEGLGEVAAKDWHRHQIIEWLRGLDSIKTAEQLVAYHQATKSQQRFRHFGTWYGERIHAPRQKAEATREPATTIETVRCDLHPLSPVKVRLVRGVDLDQFAMSSGADTAHAGRRHPSPGPAP